MKRKYFTEEEIELLRKNPYTFQVNSRQIFFTAAFKKAFMQLYNSGRSAVEAVRELGYDPAILGNGRINSIRKNTISQLTTTGNLHEGPHNLNKETSSLKLPAGSSSDEIARLKQEVAFLRAEIEFIKKSLSLARKRK
ncbi:MAG: transposase [Acidaminococcus sp.]|jgi:hypothetical protein|nr:transposase [Acidaminococcus sp.]MCH3951272.1 transposase [Acidaminococcus sp.]